LHIHWIQQKLVFLLEIEIKTKKKDKERKTNKQQQNKEILYKRYNKKQNYILTRTGSKKYTK